ncbi:hypothetical protein GCM10010439_39960 [Actinocorallia aurantiaca]|uniref:Uncharacterized protein n=1 Tax=Actinocorallia aurantiaca TaxID=46204 RepID=A0ABP6GUL2_9ACTN
MNASTAAITEKARARRRSDAMALSLNFGSFHRVWSPNPQERLTRPGAISAAKVIARIRAVPRRPDPGP